MGRKRKDRSKDNYPAKNQATILNFKGFERSVQSSEPQEIKTPQFCCEFCGLSHCHDGARKKHQSSCDRKPVEAKEFYCKKCTSVQPVDDATEVESWMKFLTLFARISQVDGIWQKFSQFSLPRKKNQRN